MKSWLVVLFNTIAIIPFEFVFSASTQSNADKLRLTKLAHVDTDNLVRKIINKKKREIALFRIENMIYLCEYIHLNQ